MLGRESHPVVSVQAGAGVLRHQAGDQARAGLRRQGGAWRGHQWFASVACSVNIKGMAAIDAHKRVLRKLISSPLIIIARLVARWRPFAWAQHAAKIEDTRSLGDGKSKIWRFISMARMLKFTK